MTIREIRPDQESTIEIVKMSPGPGNWQNLPHYIFGDLMSMMARENLHELQKCRQVCQSWNVMTSQMTKNEKDTIWKKAESLADQIRENLNRFPPLLPEITTPASLAHHGMLDCSMNLLLGPVNFVSLRDVDLASVPAEHLASLTSCVTHNFEIENVSNCDIVNIFDHVTCLGLDISRQTLSCEETQALVRAMETRVRDVVLGHRGGEVSLDITALTQYSGQGECQELEFHHDAATRYSEEVRSWTRRINWQHRRFNTTGSLEIWIWTPNHYPSLRHDF